MTNNLYDLIEYEESEPMPEDEDGMMHLHFHDDYYDEENNYYSGLENTKKHGREDDDEDHQREHRQREHRAVHEEVAVHTLLRISLQRPPRMAASTTCAVAGLPSGRPSRWRYATSATISV